MEKFFSLLVVFFASPAFDKIEIADNGHENTGNHFMVKNEILHTIEKNLFGQFLERASWGEPGPEGAVLDGTHALQPSVQKLVKEMKIPIIRFPHGGDEMVFHWTDMIDNVPERAGPRPISQGVQEKMTNRFGIDEFLRMCESQGSESILVVNFYQALSKQRSLEDACLEASGLIAYCNSPLDSKLPPDMPNWSKIREKNGQAVPYGVKYVQIGNEIFGYFDNLMQSLNLKSPAEQAAWCLTCLKAYIEAVKAVDEKIKIIIEGDWSKTNFEVCRLILSDQELRKKADYISNHFYSPWNITQVTKNKKPVDVRTLSDKDIWLAWVSTPYADSEGHAVLQSSILDLAREFNWQVAVTEWNFNGGWQMGKADDDLLKAPFIKGVGAAGYLHALMRQGNLVKIGCQSLLLGCNWNICAIRYDSEAKTEPYYFPTGQVTFFYSQHHGNQLLKLEENTACYEQPFSMGSINPEKKVKCIDAIVTKDKDKIYFHAINRYFDQDAKITVDLSEFSNLDKTASHHIFEGDFEKKFVNDGTRKGMGWFSEKEINFDGQTLQAVLPKRSVSIIEIEIKK